MKKSITYILPIMIGFLAGCTTIAPSPPVTKTTKQNQTIALKQITHWQLNGKIAVQTNKDGGSASLTWMQNNQHYDISLFGPFGTHSIRLYGQKGEAHVKTAEGQSATARSPEDLLAKQWGWHLPVSYLAYWVRGLPVPQLPYKSTLNDAHHLSTLNQAGWQVAFPSYQAVDAVSLPDKIIINSAMLKVKIVIYHWTIGSA
ncbi:MAG TPA: lipoprotein insertase outer membrane protein LolB [Gammaproteobacteria bacterium]|jgi:outer membrane lipoprotein LolB|nr:lipoprotein insertase outer membrane protein LolB [Gammaproteobacteria bacterium]